jgi:hypothetical protein
MNLPRSSPANTTASRVLKLAWSAAALILASTGLTPAALAQDPIHLSPKRVTTTEAGSSVRVTGTWHKDPSASGPIPPIPPLNSATIICEKTTMRCHEAIAMLAPLIPSGPADTLLATLFVYDVQSWQPGSIRATGKTQAQDLEILIDLKKSSVVRTSQETAARGASTANPERRFSWSLR